MRKVNKKIRKRNPRVENCEFRRGFARFDGRVRGGETVSCGDDPEMNPLCAVTGPGVNPSHAETTPGLDSGPAECIPEREDDGRRRGDQRISPAS